MKLKVSNLKFNYTDKKIINNLSFEVSSSSVTSLVGSSGVGKTTLFSLIAGFLTPREGEIFIDKTMINDLKAEQRPIVTMFQEGGLFPHLSILENVKFGLKTKFNKKRFKNFNIDKYAKELLDKVGLSNLDHRYAHELSGGQKQRVSLARAIAVKPKVLLLDEPFSALDPKLKYQLNLLLKKIVKDEDIVAIKITHDLDDALVSSDNIMLIEDADCYISSPKNILSGSAHRRLLKYFKAALEVKKGFGVMSKNFHLDQKGQRVSFNVGSIRNIGSFYEYLLISEFGSINYVSDKAFSGSVDLSYDPESVFEFLI